ncbi:hypothetical protein HMPREF0372_02617 [Flavonifractor plautii ATCC 29863]|uniref:Uncharacterized protein n=1 Tax=Flavonifractor plautii ATCC 29863 TaxID=411475 RepID=G9YSV9_FLAPL|nr:hypothetical protein HMPREF0372_02617 [Flavonifractor plautii ATCC 29863]
MIAAMVSSPSISFLARYYNSVRFKRQARPAFFPNQYTQF